VECEWRVCVSFTDALVGHSWAYGEIMRLADALVSLSGSHIILVFSTPYDMAIFRRGPLTAASNAGVFSTKISLYLGNDTR